MDIGDLRATVDADQLGDEMYQLIAELYPLCRSITGNGVRDTLKRIARRVPLDVHEIPSGTRVFDWTVPKEWNIRDAYVKNGQGERIIDFQKSNLHVVSYSRPVGRRMSLAELREHLFSVPEHPDWIPYRTAYYKEDWGFCVTQRQATALSDPEYEVCIDSSLEDGHLTYGELYLRGERAEEILLSCHTCHPSLCNDNLSGVALVTCLAKQLAGVSLRHSVRVLFIPGTIGAIAWLYKNEAIVPRIRHGLVIACVGDSGSVTYKKSRRGDAEVDRAAVEVLKHAGAPYTVMEFEPYGYDERQFCSPGFNLPVGCFMRTPHGRFAEYHTSADNLEFVQPKCLADSFRKVLGILEVVDRNRTYANQNPKCEPHLGRRGLYRSIGGQADGRTDELALLWVLNLSDEQNSLLDIAARSGMEFAVIRRAADRLIRHGLLREPGEGV